MKSIIMIAYYFPPEGNAGTYRPLRFARALAALGWEIEVVSADPYCYERYDPGLLKSVPSGIKVNRVRGFDLWQAFQSWRRKRVNLKIAEEGSRKYDQMPISYSTTWRAKIRNAVRKMEYSFYIPDRAMPWIQPAFNAACQSCKTKKPDVIWATIGPISSGLVALRASEEMGVPYVLDFRDPWGLNFYQIDLIRPNFSARKVQCIMRQILERARAVVFLFDSVAECYLRNYPGAIDEKKIHIIPNGFEGELDDFKINPSEKCTILYSGTLSTYRYDTLLQGLQILKQKHPLLANQVRILFVGDSNQPLKKEATKIGLTDIIDTRDPVPYQEVQKIQKKAHAFLILGRQADVKGHELVAGAKLFGYLQARRPIIGVLPYDETRNVLINVGVQTIADVEFPEEIATVFNQVIKGWLDGRLEILLPDPLKCEIYSIKRQRDALIEALEGK